MRSQSITPCKSLCKKPDRWTDPLRSILFLDPTGFPKLRTMERRRPRNPPTRPLVLIVDSHDDTRALYALALSGMGFDVVPASDSEDGYFRAWTTHPDIIVTELSITPIDGWTFVRDLKDDPRTRDIPVVILTGHGQASVREQAEREGCAALFLKPCLPEQLAVGLRELLHRQSTPAHAISP